MTHRYLLVAMTVAAGPFVLASEADSRDQAPFVVAQQQPNQADPRRRPPPRPAVQPPPPQAPPARPPVQPQRPVVQPQRPALQPQPPAVQRPQQFTPQPQRPVAQPPRQVQPQRPGVQPQRPAGQPAVQPPRPGVQPPRPVVQPRPPGAQPQRPAAQPPAPGVRQPVVRRPAPRIDTLRDQRRETRQGNRVVIREPGRTIVREGPRTIVRHDDLARLRLRSQGMRTEWRGNERVTYVNRPGGVVIINITDRNGRLIRRIRRDRWGREIVIIDNRRRPGVVIGLIGAIVIAAPVIAIARDRYIVEADVAPPALLYDTLTAPPVEPLERAYSLDEIAATPNLRDRMPRIDIDTITFDTGSWEVTPEEADKLAPIADAIRRAIEKNPNEVFMIEGHTDAVGDEIDNLSLSDRRAEAVAIVLTEQYGIPPENLTTQGYGEQQLKLPTGAAERRNRRVTVRRITPLLTGEAQPQAPGDPPPGAQPDQPPQGEPGQPQQGEPGQPPQSDSEPPPTAPGRQPGGG